MSCDHWTCAVITRQILWSQKMLITRHILRSLNMSCDHRTCCGITWYFLWSQDVSCDHETCRVITEYVLWSLDIFCVQWICRVTTRLYPQIRCYGYKTCFGLLDISCDHRTCRGITWKFLWSQDVSWDHKLCRVMTEYVLWSLDLFCGWWKCRVIIRHVFWSWGMSYDHNTCPVIAEYVSGSRNISCDPKTWLAVRTDRPAVIPWKLQYVSHAMYFQKAPCGDRTHDRTLTKRMLCQLS